MTLKRKETERKHILSVSLKVSDIESSHCIASAERGWFFEHPFKAVGDLRPCHNVPIVLTRQI